VTRSLLSPVLSSRFWQKLLEIFQQIWSATEQVGDLRIYVLNRLRLALVCLEDFEKLFVNIWLLGKPILIKRSAKAQTSQAGQLTLILFT
jgi:hypothetical protein